MVAAKGTTVALVASLLLGGVAAWAWPRRMVAPGPLHEGHARLSGSCRSCHVPFSGPSVDKCVTCHPVSSIGLKTVDGAVRTPQRPRTPIVHRAMMDTGISCDACHAEHARGPIRTLSFKHELFPDQVRTNCLACHDAERPQTPVHRQATSACGSCHATTAWKPARFSHDGLTAEQRPQCATCHASKRPADTIHTASPAECGTCHSTSAWRPASFDHQRYFRFDRRHPSTCATCHQVAGNFKTYTCYGCHEHTPAKMQAEHRRQQGQNLDQCARCHRSGDEHGAEGGEGGDGRGERRSREGRRRGDDEGH